MTVTARVSFMTSVTCDWIEMSCLSLVLACVRRAFAAAEDCWQEGESSWSGAEDHRQLAFVWTHQQGTRATSLINHLSHFMFVFTVLLQALAITHYVILTSLALLCVSVLPILLLVTGSSTVMTLSDETSCCWDCDHQSEYQGVYHLWSY